MTFYHLFCMDIGKVSALNTAWKVSAFGFFPVRMVQKNPDTNTFYSVQYAFLLFIKKSEISVDKKEYVRAVLMD